MTSILHRPRWGLPESAATPEALYWNRRALLKTMGLGAIAAGVTGCGEADVEPGPSGGATGSAKAPPAIDDLFPASRADAFMDAGRAITDADLTSTYNNFYEFGSHKRIHRAAQDLVTRPWTVTIDGEVETPIEIDAADLTRRMGVEERVYRHRCVEAWSMVVPWTGFPMKKLVDFAKPLSSARFVKMETFFDPDVASGQRQSWYPWPYTEGLTLAEATNELAFLVVGVYGAPAAPQFGAPLRLATPWKYGFKSIKSIVRFTFTRERPTSFWEATGPSEYGFWANVNPKIPHPRWSQASERVLGTDESVPTQFMNGYAEWVSGLYPNLDDPVLYR